MDDNIIFFKSKKDSEKNYDDVLPEVTLRAAIRANLKRVFVVGIDDSGDYWYASSSGNFSTLLWDVEKFKKFILEGDEHDQ